MESRKQSDIATPQSTGQIDTTSRCTWASDGLTIIVNSRDERVVILLHPYRKPAGPPAPKWVDGCKTGVVCPEDCGTTVFGWNEFDANRVLKAHQRSSRCLRRAS